MLEETSVDKDLLVSWEDLVSWESFSKSISSPREIYDKSWLIFERIYDILWGLMGLELDGLCSTLFLTVQNCSTRLISESSAVKNYLSRSSSPGAVKLNGDLGTTLAGKTDRGFSSRNRGPSVASQ
jgi:hypothetical protein